MRIITRLVMSGNRRRYLGTYLNIKTKTWSLAWSNPTAHGYDVEKPIETGFKTKKIALARKKEILAR